MARSGWDSKQQQRQAEAQTGTLRRLERVGRMHPLPLTNILARSDLKTRGAQVSFEVRSLEGVDHVVLLRNFSRDPGSAKVLKVWPIAGLKTTPQRFPIALRHTDADPDVAGKTAYYWVKAVPVSTRTAGNEFLSEAQQFDASQYPTARQITGDFAATQAYTPTTQPLTATTGGPVNSATISVASFQIQYPFDGDGDGIPDLITYNSGSITPLLDATQYFVYFDDPTYTGGPQTYIASVDNPKVTSGLHRQYLGNIITPAHGGGGTGGGGGGGGACFTGNTRVKTKDGWRPIALIKVGDEVESLAGWVKVSAKLDHWYEGAMHAMGFGEFVTPDHRMWMNRSWVAAKELWPADPDPFKGHVYNLHCDGKDDFERCYRLLNGHVAHNTRKF